MELFQDCRTTFIEINRAFLEIKLANEHLSALCAENKPDSFPVAG